MRVILCSYFVCSVLYGYYKGEYYGTGSFSNSLMSYPKESKIVSSGGILEIWWTYVSAYSFFPLL